MTLLDPARTTRQARAALLVVAALASTGLAACQPAQVCGCPRDGGATVDDADDEVSARFTLASQTVCTADQLDAGCENLLRPRP